jgi:hypothetical protein
VYLLNRRLRERVGRREDKGRRTQGCNGARANKGRSKGGVLWPGSTKRVINPTNTSGPALLSIMCGSCASHNITSFATQQGHSRGNCGAQKSASFTKLRDVSNSRKYCSGCAANGGLGTSGGTTSMRDTPEDIVVENRSLVQDMHIYQSPERDVSHSSKRFLLQFYGYTAL